MIFEPVLEPVLNEPFGELVDAAQEADWAVAAGLGGGFPFLGIVTMTRERPLCVSSSL